MDEAVQKVIKGAEIIMQNAVLLQHQISQLQLEIQYRKRRQKRTKHFIQNRGSLTVAEGREKIEGEWILQEDWQPRQRQPQTYSNCNILGHIRVQCPSKLI